MLEAYRSGEQRTEVVAAIFISEFILGMPLGFDEELVVDSDRSEYFLKSAPLTRWNRRELTLDERESPELRYVDSGERGILGQEYILPSDIEIERETEDYLYFGLKTRTFQRLRYPSQFQYIDQWFGRFGGGPPFKFDKSLGKVVMEGKEFSKEESDLGSWRAKYWLFTHMKQGHIVDLLCR
jgi:hypothetical protein